MYINRSETFKVHLSAVREFTKWVCLVYVFKYVLLKNNSLLTCRLQCATSSPESGLAKKFLYAMKSRSAW